MSEAAKHIDWQRAHEALERARGSLEEGARPSASAARLLLERRAAVLARSRSDADVRDEVLDLLVFCSGADRYAVDSREVAEVLPPCHPTPVPFTPPAVLGVIGHRARIVAVVDVARLHSRAPSDGLDAGLVVVLEGEAALGLRADSLVGVEAVDPRAIAPADAEADEHGVISGVTDGMVAIVDVQALAADRRIVVDDVPQ